MPKKNYYEDIKFIKKPLKSRIKSMFIFFVIVLVVVSCFGIATYLSSALTVGNLGDLIIYGNTNLKIEKSTLYAVTLGEYDTFDEGEKVSMGVMVQGASGYVWEDGKFFVIGNIYSNYDDALKVKDNLKESNYNVGIKEINFPKLQLDFQMYENEDMSIIKKSIEILNVVYKKLYDFSVKYDKKEITNLAVSSGLSELRGELKGIIVSVQNLINISDSKLKKIQTALIKTDELLDQVIIKTIDNSSTNYSIKYAISSIVRIKYDLFVELV